jgi:hypothetical protein
VLPLPSFVVTDEEDLNDDYLVDPTEYAPEDIVDVTGTLEIHEAPDPVPVISKSMRWKKKKVSYTKTPSNIEAAQIESLQATLGSKSCVEIFELSFDSEVLILLVTQTNLLHNTIDIHSPSTFQICGHFKGFCFSVDTTNCLKNECIGHWTKICRPRS